MADKTSRTDWWRSGALTARLRLGEPTIGLTQVAVLIDRQLNESREVDKLHGRLTDLAGLWNDVENTESHSGEQNSIRPSHDATPRQEADASHISL